MVFVSIIVGFLIGLLYRFWFVRMQTKIGFLTQTNSNTPTRLFFETIVLSFARIVLISALLTYLLLSNAIHLIIVTLVCGITIALFGVIKDIAHGRH